MMSSHEIMRLPASISVDAPGLFFGAGFMNGPEKLTAQSGIERTARREAAQFRKSADRLRTVCVLQTGRGREAGD